jgi:hypothetical protein
MYPWVSSEASCSPQTLGSNALFLHVPSFLMCSVWLWRLSQWETKHASYLHSWLSLNNFIAWKGKGELCGIGHGRVWFEWGLNCSGYTSSLWYVGSCWLLHVARGLRRRTFCWHTAVETGGSFRRVLLCSHHIERTQLKQEVLGRTTMPTFPT